MAIVYVEAMLVSICPSTSDGIAPLSCLSRRPLVLIEISSYATLVSCCLSFPTLAMASLRPNVEHTLKRAFGLGADHECLLFELPRTARRNMLLRIACPLGDFMICTSWHRSASTLPHVCKLSEADVTEQVP